MEEPTQQPNDNSKREADRIGSEELEAAVLAAVQRATEAHSAEPPADTSADESFAGGHFTLTGDIIPSSHQLLDDNNWLVGMIAESDELPDAYVSADEDEDLPPQTLISPPVEEV